MIGANGSDIVELVAQLSLFMAGTQRRRAFRDGAEPREVFVAQHKIMRACFARDIDATRACFGDKSDTASATDVHDV